VAETFSSSAAQPLRVPVSRSGGRFVESPPQDTYSRVLDFRHIYEVPVADDSRFAWKNGYAFSTTPEVRAQKYFAVEGRLSGLGYMVDSSGTLTAAPVIVADHWSGALRGSRIVVLDFDPVRGYWKSQDGISLIRQAAAYASIGATALSVEMLFSCVRPDEPPEITVHLRQTRAEILNASIRGELNIILKANEKVVETSSLPVEAKDGTADIAVPVGKPLPKGFYTISATLSENGQFREFYENGFWVEETDALNGGSVLGVQRDVLTRDGKPFFPVGTNYFTTEENGWDFSGPRNSSVWERDFEEMARRCVTFVRTGVWMANGRFIEASNGGANERFLRNLEAFLFCAQKNKIAANFTFFAFSPRSGTPGRESTDAVLPNPYTDPASVLAEEEYIRSVVERFKGVPWLSYDLVNEPSFSNPRHVFQGNYPNGDSTELAAWRRWLRQKYGALDSLAKAWTVPPAELKSLEEIPLPTISDLTYDRYRNTAEVRAVDYNLFAQDMFSDWVRKMVALVRGTGSGQLIDVGQDEGGVTDRVLNQFFGGAGVSFTTNHTYWQDDALLWDSIVAKRPGVPNITGETGYQPVWAPDGSWRYDEFTGLGLIERKWALGFAAGSTGAMQWDWAREVDFGMLRSDGSAKVWEGMMHDLGVFAVGAAPSATSLVLPQIAIVLPQSYQLSVYHQFALEAQQSAVRALCAYARSEAYAVGEYQIDPLGSPKLIILPSPFGLSEAAWQVIRQKVEDGATLLISGPFDEDEHLQSTGRQDAVGLAYRSAPLVIREHSMQFPGGAVDVHFSRSKTTELSRAVLASGADWAETALGKGRILFSALPLELNTNLNAVGEVYKYAIKIARVEPRYTTTLSDPGIIIAPTSYPEATLYVVTSESNQTRVIFRDERSGRMLSESLDPGHASMVLVSREGHLLASYRWRGD
jgi:glycosyl hydrolase family 42 (putative beta-galactosidase)